MKKSIDTYKELMTEMEKNPEKLYITKDLFDWLYKYTDSTKLAKNKITIKGSPTICMLGRM